MNIEHRTATGIPGWILAWFAVDAVLTLTPAFHWALTGETRVFGLPSAIVYFVGVALFICTSLVAAYMAEAAAGRFEQ